MKYLLIIFLTVVVASCKLRDNPVTPESGTRNYYLGFTPFPYDLTSQADQYVYNKIADDADIINHQFDDGIPWEEALSNTDFNSNITDDWQFRRSNTPSGHKVIVSVTPINPTRSGLALYKAEEGNMSLPFPWDGYNFNNPYVEEAYLNYCKRIIDYFSPDYFVMGIEVNLLITADPTLTEWEAYVTLQQYVYDELKNIYPNLPMMVSFSGMDLINSYTDADNAQQLNGFSELATSTDYFAIALYPFRSNFRADSYPSGMFDILFSMSNKPICITETGYPAQTSSINGGTIYYNGTTEKQDTYFSDLFAAADNYNVQFIINFAVRDFDKVWEANGSPDDLSKVLKDTGLYDEDGNARPAYDTWKNKLNLSIQK